MSDDSQHQDEQQGSEQRDDAMTERERAEQMPDELKVDVDQDKMRAWDEVSEDYSTDADSDEQPPRPVFTDERQERSPRQDDAADSGSEG
ncbi:hypothetical protein G9U51_02040 [Calidifontibacter sp. DB0510]|uniref:Uncharacterized protein n=1 Tax=Metallococcus carri TaxID=1656884 RepID=A0A967AZ94_9MICO|nr:hypothetical protein [Metallococcus carri]NHN54560.1 hypothetical protein [Metallococcus carri]NOP36601.1 hypothetical protein [Calidifontibacter sp. DB2511S]